LFKSYHIPLIQARVKVDTRRMWPEDGPRVKVNSKHLIKTKIFTKENFGAVQILSLRWEPLLDITEEGAKREGNYTRESYLKLIREIYPDAPENPKLWVIGFAYLGDGQ
jgi:uncharacterized protein YqfB (UPF0267 family)